MCIMFFFLRLGYTIKPNNIFFPLFNSEINSEMDNFLHIFPAKPFKLLLKIYIYPEEVRRVLSLGARRSEYYEQEESEEEPIINIRKSFKYDECIICLTNLPNVLFCNCGHIAICEECDKMKSLNTCPICKTKSTIK